MAKKSIAERALRICASHLLARQLEGCQITMYEGKWDAMLDRKVLEYIALAKAQAKKEGRK